MLLYARFMVSNYIIECVLFCSFTLADFGPYMMEVGLTTAHFNGDAALPYITVVKKGLVLVRTL